VRRALALAALLGALGAAACASAPWTARRSVSEASFRGRLYVPRLYAPMLPGSVYPNRRVTVPARGRPGVVVVVPDRLFARATKELGDRGLVVLRLQDRSGLAEAAAWLASQPECVGASVGAELAGEVPRDWPASVKAFALVGAAPGRRSSSTPVLSLSTSLATGLDPAWAVRTYGAPERFDASDLVPPQGWRDAAEWLAATLESAARPR
jgi:hypothetical protein